MIRIFSKAACRFGLDGHHVVLRVTCPVYKTTKTVIVDDFIVDGNTNPDLWILTAR